MTENIPRNKGKIKYPFGGGENLRSTNVVSFDDEVAGRINDDKGNLGVWPDNVGGISDDALKNIEEFRPVENNPELDEWSGKD